MFPWLRLCVYPRKWLANEETKLYQIMLFLQSIHLGILFVLLCLVRFVLILLLLLYHAVVALLCGFICHFVWKRFGLTFFSFLFVSPYKQSVWICTICMHCTYVCMRAYEAYQNICAYDEMALAFFAPPAACTTCNCEGGAVGRDAAKQTFVSSRWTRDLELGLNSMWNLAFSVAISVAFCYCYLDSAMLLLLDIFLVCNLFNFLCFLFGCGLAFFECILLRTWNINAL